jgi:hypothetical protein
VRRQKIFSATIFADRQKPILRVAPTTPVPKESVQAMTSRKSKLRVIAACAALAGLAVAMSCRGFFQNPVLDTITIQPPTPSVEVGQTASLEAWGTYNDNSRSQITSGVVWSSSDPTTISIDQNSGIMSGLGTGGTATITAAAQGLTGTATATAFIGTVTGFEVCQGTFTAGSCPNPAWTVSSSSGGTQTFNAEATYNGSQIDLTTQATWNPSTSSNITCDNTSSPATCTMAGSGETAQGSYTIVVTYGTAYSFTIDVTVGP